MAFSIFGLFRTGSAKQAAESKETAPGLRTGPVVTRPTRHLYDKKNPLKWVYSWDTDVTRWRK